MKYSKNKPKFSEFTPKITDVAPIAASFLYRLTYTLRLLALGHSRRVKKLI
jgi:hypothetical protein